MWRLVNGSTSVSGMGLLVVVMQSSSDSMGPAEIEIVAE